MLKIYAKKTTDSSHPAQTLVLLTQATGKKLVALSPNKEMNLLLQKFENEGLTTDQVKKGLFMRSVGPSPYNHLMVISFDKKSKDLEKVREMGASIFACLRTHKQKSFAINIDDIVLSKSQAAMCVSAFTQGLELAAYSFDQYKSKKKAKAENKKSSPETEETQLEEVQLLAKNMSLSQNIKKGIDHGQTLAGCVNFSRRLGDTPGNLMTPEILATEVVNASKGSKLKVTIWDKARIKKESMGGLLGVSLGSAVEPRFIIMEYNGAAKSKKPVCFVGKGLTFDSGGISIKPSAGMEEMKFDKCGGANVIGTLLAIAKLKLKVNAIGLVPATENMPGPLANKPGDILIARNGKSVEVDNTDAEGRLILMDALSYACEQKPAAIFDAATLTGACVIALGNIYTGCFTRSEKLRKKISEAAKISGESVWHMPICDHHLSDMKGTYADLNNISSNKGAGSSTAAAFLEQFVDKDIPWAHFDIAGTAWHVGNRLNYCPRKGASGAIIRTFVELSQSFG